MQLQRDSKALVYEQICQYVLTEIKEKRLTPGMQLSSERRLAELLGVSRPSVRQAISVLVSRGILVVTPRGGAVVVSNQEDSAVGHMAEVLSQEPDNILHLLEVRKIFEAAAARLAAKRATASDVLPIRMAALALEEAWRQGRVDDAAGAQFHLGLVKAAHNPLLTRMWELVGRAMAEGYHEMREFLLAGEDSDTFLEEHSGVCDAVAAGDGERAAALLTAHIDRVERLALTGRAAVARPAQSP